VTRAADEALEQHAVVAKPGQRFSLGRVQCILRAAGKAQWANY
jgi:hypothetical protein